MNYLLDTNVVSELRRPPGVVSRPVVTWARRQSARDLYLSMVTILEIELGVLRMKRRDPGQAATLRTWLTSGVLAGFAGRIVPVDTEVALQAARLHVPDPRPERDAYIAATALVHGLVVVTRNLGDFDPTGVATLNPWEE